MDEHLAEPSGLLDGRDEAVEYETMVIYQEPLSHQLVLRPEHHRVTDREIEWMSPIAGTAARPIRIATTASKERMRVISSGYRWAAPERPARMAEAA